MIVFNSFLKIKSVNASKVDIKFVRNVPTNLKEKVEIFSSLAQSQKLADEDLLAILPKELLPNLEEALDRLKKQKEENAKMFDLDNAQVDEDENIEEEKEKL